MSRRLHPLGLVLKAGTWYVAAQAGALGNENVRTYRVSNILDLQSTGERFTRPRDFDLVRFWTASSHAYEIGLYRGNALLRISQRGMARLETLGATVHQAAQETAEPEKSGGWARVTIPIESIDQATLDMLKLGAEAEVLKPVALRRKVARAARDVARLNS